MTTPLTLLEAERLRLAVRAANIGLWDWDLATNQVYFSREWKRQIGYEDHEIASDFQEWQGRVHPDEVEGAVRTVRAYLAHPTPDFRLEFRLRHKDGSYRWMLAHASLVRDAQGTPVRMLGAHVDITDRKQAEADRRQVLERVTDAFVALDTNWHYTYVNARAAQMFGRRADDLIGKHIWTEFREGVGQKFHLAYEQAMADQQPVFLEEYYPPYDRWFENRIYPSPEGLTIYFHDITERKRTETLLSAQKQVLEMIAGGTSLPETLTALVRLIEAQSPGMLGSILLLDEDGVHVRHGAAPSLPAEFVATVDGQPIGPCAGSCGTAAYRKEAVIVEDIATDPLWAAYKAAVLPHGLRACWSTPIFDASRRVLGTFAMYYRQPRLPLPEHQRLIDAATHTAAIAISRHRTETALHAKTEELNRYFTNSLDLLCIADTDGHFRRLNPEWERTLGYSPAELKGRRFLDLVHPEDLAATLAALGQLSSQEHVLNFVNRCRHKDGTYLWLEWRSFAEDSRIFAVARDITVRIQTEKALRKSEARLRSVFEQANDGIYIISAENRYLEANASGLELLGYTRDQLLQMSVADVLAPHEVARLAVEPPRMMSGAPHLAEWDHVRKDSTCSRWRSTQR